MNSSDKIWLEDQQRNGWTLPWEAPWWKKLPGIRHARFVYHSLLLDQQRELWRSTRIFALAANPYDDWVTYAIFRGWA